MTEPTTAPPPAGSLRLVELLAPLSLVTDLGMGAPDEDALRSCLLATALARRMGLPEDTVSDVYYTTLLKHIGCTATAHDEAARFGGNELTTRPLISPTDFGRSGELVSLLSRVGSGYGPFKRVGVVARMATSNRWAIGIQAAICEVASLLAARLGMSPVVETAMGHLYERWDGKGDPHRLSGDDIALPTRFATLAARATAFHAAGGVDASLAAVQDSAGGWFDPVIANAFAQHGGEILAEIDSADPLPATVDAEPQPHRIIPASDVDAVANAFADMVDLKSVYTLGHSPGVAGLAADAAHRLGCAPADTDALRHVALLHDLGRAAVPSGIWDKPGSLTSAERERVQMHPYYSERILGRVPSLAPMAAVAGMHHERHDGSGYHRGARDGEIPLHARILAAADTYHAMLEPRPHRPAREASAAAEQLLELSSQGKLDPEVVHAVLDAAGHDPPPIARTLPAGITERELEVLRLVAVGRSNREIADTLVISRRTAEHHVQHIYDKIGVSTRAAATMFALQHNLLTLNDPLPR